MYVVVVVVAVVWRLYKSERSPGKVTMVHLEGISGEANTDWKVSYGLQRKKPISDEETFLLINFDRQ